MIGIVNYGMGNLKSIQNAFRYLNVGSMIVESPRQIMASSKLIMPGVGSFARAMENIHRSKIIDQLNEMVLLRGTPILGICLGMQLLASYGEENGPCAGLGYIPGKIRKMAESHSGSEKLPHLGFNAVTFTQVEEGLYVGLHEKADFYFAHKYIMTCDSEEDVSSYAMHTEKFASSVCRGNIHGVQFHPEKSQSNGLSVLRNFAAL